MNSISNRSNKLLRLFPPPLESTPLRQLYLNQQLRGLGTESQPFVYTNFIASLDGRISLEHPQKKTRLVPKAIANSKDWRLFQELAAQADVLVTSGRYIRQLARNIAQDILPVSKQPEYADLIQWRQSQGLPPQPAVVIVSAGLNIPTPEPLLRSKRPIYVATGPAANPTRIQALTEKGMRVIFVGEGMRVRGRELIAALGREGFVTIYAISGPEVLNTLVSDGMLDRLYLTHALRILGSEAFDTLLKGNRLKPPADFALRSLYYDAPDQGEFGQIFATYESARPKQGEETQS